MRQIALYSAILPLLFTVGRSNAQMTLARQALLSDASYPAAVIPVSPAIRNEITRLDGHRVSADSLERAVTRIMEHGHVPGLAVAVINNGKIVYLGGFGYRDVQQQLPLTDTSVMYAASLTKAMFANLVMQLVEDGVFSLDTPIGTLLPQPLPSYAKYAELASDPRWKLLTPRMLLNHTSGFPNFRFTEPDTQLRFRADPGSRYGYSGEGINLLQFVIEAHTGQTVEQLMRDRVFRRLGMTRTSMVWDTTFASDYALGSDDSGKQVGHKRRTGARAAGSADSDIRDMARFLQATLAGGALTPASHREMIRPQIAIKSTFEFPTAWDDSSGVNANIQLSYGLGWGLYRSKFGPAYFKEGHDDESWRNFMIAFDAPRSGVVFMSTSARAEAIYPALLTLLLGETDAPTKWLRYE